VDWPTIVGIMTHYGLLGACIDYLLYQALRLKKNIIEQNILWVSALRDPIHLGLLQADPLCPLILTVLSRGGKKTSLSKCDSINKGKGLGWVFLITFGFSIPKPIKIYPLECSGQK